MYNFDRHHSAGSIQDQAELQMTLAEIDVCIKPWSVGLFLKAAKNEGYTEKQVWEFFNATYADGYLIEARYKTRRKFWVAIALIALAVVWTAFVFMMIEPAHSKGFNVQKCIAEQRCGGKDNPRDTGPKFGGGVCYKIGGCN